MNRADLTGVTVTDKFLPVSVTCDHCGEEGPAGDGWWGYRRCVYCTYPVRFACYACLRRYYPRRSDNRYCSNACRQRAYRQRKAGQ